MEFENITGARYAVLGGVRFNDPRHIAARDFIQLHALASRCLEIDGFCRPCDRCSISAGWPARCPHCKQNGVVAVTQAWIDSQGEEMLLHIVYDLKRWNFLKRKGNSGENQTQH